MVPMTVDQSRIETEIDDDGHSYVSVHNPGLEYRVDILIASTTCLESLGPYQLYKVRLRCYGYSTSNKHAVILITFVD